MPSRLLCALWWLLLLLARAEARPEGPKRPKGPAPAAALSWPSGFVQAEQVPAALAGVLVLDARAGGAFRAGHLPGAVRIDWTDYRDGVFTTGKLPRDLDAVAARLARLGVDGRTPVLVCGEGKEGWGEEGRIAWMLRYLGHPAVAVLDGGCLAWAKAGRPLTTETRSVPAGRFVARPVPDLRAEKADVVRALVDPVVQLVDARTLEEFHGRTPYFEARGGHIPGAVHLDYRALFDEEGRLLDEGRSSAQLIAAGLDVRRPMIVYCTGGVRSAQLVLALRERGVDARNYDGSFWEWAKDEALLVEPARPPAAFNR